MKNSLRAVFGVGFLLLATAIRTWAAPAIVIKLDDLTTDESSVRHFGNVFALLEKHGIKGSFGVIGQRYLDEPGKDKSAAYATIRGWSKSGVVEIWHHGWVHSPTEFNTASLADQLQAFRQTIDIMREKCGIELVTFGAPHNATDATTVQALNELGTIKYWMFPTVKEGSNLVLLTRRLNMEVATGDVRFEHLKANYEKHADWPYMVLQGHANRWDEPQLKEFEAIVEFLKAQGCEFLTPCEAGERFGR